MEELNLSGPLTVGWDITNRCNLRCKHCYAEAGKSFDEVSFDKVKSVLDELSRLGTVLIALSGGEPLLHPNIFEIIKYIKSKGFELFINTNGTMITNDFAKKLKDSGVRHIEISIDGLEKNHDFIRGEGSFKKALEGFESCKEVGISTGIMTTIFKTNMNDVEELIDLFHKKGAVGIGFLRFKPVGRGTKYKSFELSPEERKNLLERVYKKKVKIGNGFHIKVETPLSILVANKYPELMAEHSYLNAMSRGCPGGIISCHIKSNGDVAHCPQMTYPVGNILNETMEEIWKSDMFKKLRKRTYKGKCNICKHKRVCGGCRTSAYVHTGDILESDPGCWYEPESKVIQK